MLNKIKRFVKGIKLNTMLIKGIKNDNLNPEFLNTEINSEGYIQRQNTRILINSHVCVAGVSLIQFGFNYVPCIYTDALFDQLSKEAQDFIIQHEMGHFTYHIDHLIHGFERNDEMEQQADLYAAQIVGYENAIKGLEELKNILDLVSFGKNKYGITEIEKRIAYIKAYAEA